MHSHPSKNNVSVMKDRQDMGTILHKDFQNQLQREELWRNQKKCILIIILQKECQYGGREREREKQNKYEHYSNRFQKLISLLYNSILSRFNKCQIINKISIQKKKLNKIGTIIKQKKKEKKVIATLINGIWEKLGTND